MQISELYASDPLAMTMKHASRHPVQYAILEDLRTAPTGLRYRDMKPDDIENDAYNYHLQYLVHQGLVTKIADRYQLSSSGKKYLVELNPIDEKGESHRFKLAALCLLVRRDDDGIKLLYQHRTRQPFAGERGIIGGGLRRGELAVDTAHRRLREEAGLVATFSLLGLIRKRHFDSTNQIYSDILYHVCLSQKYSGELVSTNEYGEQSWITLDQAVTIESHQASGSRQFAQVLLRLKDTAATDMPLFYLEETYTRDIY